ncbi:MAG TPA: hypothetical protein VIF60_05255 [Burkholderiaceae bacterium]
MKTLDSLVDAPGIGECNGQIGLSLGIGGQKRRGGLQRMEGVLAMQLQANPQDFPYVAISRMVSQVSARKKLQIRKTPGVEQRDEPIHNVGGVFSGCRFAAVHASSIRP